MTTGSTSPHLPGPTRRRACWARRSWRTASALPLGGRRADAKELGKDVRIALRINRAKHLHNHRPVRSGRPAVRRHERRHDVQQTGADGIAVDETAPKGHKQHLRQRAVQAPRNVGNLERVKLAA